MNPIRGKAVYIFAFAILSAVTATPSVSTTKSYKISTPIPSTTAVDSLVKNETTTKTTTAYSSSSQQSGRKLARNFQPSLSTPTTSSSSSSSSSTSTYAYDTAKKKLSYSPPDYHSPMSGNVFGGNHAFVYNTYNEKGKHSFYSHPAITPLESINKQNKQSAKYSASLPTTTKIDRSQDDGLMHDYYAQNSNGAIREMPLMSSNSRHGYASYDDHGDYSHGGDEEYDSGHHFGSDLYSHHHHGQGHHHHFPPIHHYPPPPAVYYPAHHDKHHDDYTKLGLLAVAKLILAKIKALGIFKIILVFLAKVPLVILKIAIKFFFLFKVAKLFKLLTVSALLPLLLIPFLLLLPLLALLLLPLLALPLLLPLLLLPLLLFLPVPVPVANPAGRRRRREAVGPNDPLSGRVWKEFDVSNDFLVLTRQVLESQQCLERISCKMAARNDSMTYTNAILWLLEKFRAIAPSRIQDRLGSYIEAYKTGSKRPKSCVDKYACDKPRFLMFQDDTYYNLL